MDPKITLALQGAIYRELYGIEDCTLVQGIDSIKNTLPLAIILDEKFNTKYLPVGYLPNVDLNKVNEEDPGFIMPFMALSAAALSMHDAPQKMSEAVRKAVYDVISGSHLPHAKKNLVRSSSAVMEDLIQINKLFYGQIA